MRALNVRVEDENHIYMSWSHNPHPDLIGTIRGFKIRAWLKGGNEPVIISSKNTTLRIYELDINKNYTITVHAVTRSTTLGPGSSPVNNLEEKG